MIKTILIEDELNVRAALKKMLTILDPEINIIAETGHVEGAIELILATKPDLVFMDIELEDGNSFDILNKLANVNFKIIFTTAYNQYAIDAFKFSTIDYLLKPIDPSELGNAIQRAKNSIDNEKERKELLSVLKDNLHKKEPKIVLKTIDRRYIIFIKDILHLEADGAYTNFITTTQKIIVSKNIKFYQSILDKTFLRCHQSHLVNTQHIIGVNKNDNLIMSNNDIVPISTRKKSLILERIKI